MEQIAIQLNSISQQIYDLNKILLNKSKKEKDIPEEDEEEHEETEEEE